MKPSHSVDRGSPSHLSLTISPHKLPGGVHSAESAATLHAAADREAYVASKDKMTTAMYINHYSSVHSAQFLEMA